MSLVIIFVILAFKCCCVLCEVGIESLAVYMELLVKTSEPIKSLDTTAMCHAYHNHYFPETVFISC